MTDFGAYPRHGGQLRQIAERFGIPPGELLDFSANINPAGPPSCVLPALRRSLEDSATLAEYPDLRQIDLRQALARYTGTHEDNIVVANGFVPLLEATLRTLGVRHCLLPVPAFVEYRKTLERAGVRIVPHMLSAATSFRYDPAMLLAEECDAILLANPQNPSGVCLDGVSLRGLIAAASARNMYILLDEAFIDYVPEHELTSTIDQFPRLIRFRSVTKFYGIPGLRLAYAISTSVVTQAISDNMAPWPITTLASDAVIAALGDEAYATRSRSDNILRRTALSRDLESCGLAPYPSLANFLLFQLPSPIDPAIFWRSMIVDHRIVMRSCANYEGLAAGHFRVSVRTEGENARLVSAVRTVLANLR